MNPIDPGAPISNRGPRVLSLRAASVASVVVLAVMVLGLGVGLVVTSSRVWDATSEVERSMWAISAAEEVERSLREYHRVSNVFAATGEPEVDEARRSLAEEAGRALLELEAHASTPAQKDQRRAVAESVEAYFEARAALEARGLTLDEMVRGSRASLERALALGAELRASGRHELTQTKREAARALRVHYALAGSAAVVLLVGLGLFTIGLRRLVLAPVFGLEDAIRRFRGGDADARTEEGALLEMRHLGAAFNEMAETIAQQRREQLTFLAAVAHDLRNPLMALKLLVAGMRETPGGATPVRIERLDRQLDRLGRMVGDLLDASRIEAGHLELQLEELDLRACTRAVVELYALTTTTHVLTLACGDDPVMVRADPLRVEQVISNLLSNAIKYAPNGGPIEASVEASARWGIVSVADRGIGIAPEELAGLFEPFRRPPSTPANIPGVGLGLSIVRRIVETHGGHIEVDSRLGAGSTFRVCLPLAAPSAGPAG